MGRGFEVTGSDHVAYVVSSLEASLAFWIEGLGATLECRFAASGDTLANITGARDAQAEFAIVAIAGQRVELLQYQGVAPRSAPLRPFDAGSMHIALQVDKLAAALAHVARYGYRAQGVPRRNQAGDASMYVVGPDGATIELRQRNFAG